MKTDRDTPSGAQELDPSIKEELFSWADAAVRAKFNCYLSLILRWNARMNLTSVRDPEGIVKRHFVESARVAKLLPKGICSLLDFGSGAGFPGIPIALCRPEIAVTLAESQSKKAAFLHEAVRSLELEARVWPRRAEDLEERFDCVTMRAVDNMEAAVALATRLVRPAGVLAVLTTEGDLRRIQDCSGPEFQWSAPFLLPDSQERVMAIGSKSTGKP